MVHKMKNHGMNKMCQTIIEKSIHINCVPVCVNNSDTKNGVAV